MNLIDPTLNETQNIAGYTIEEFRQWQVENLLPHLLEISISYIARMYKKDPQYIKFKSVEIQRVNSYQHIQNSEYTNVVVKIECAGSVKQFCSFKIPTLIDGYLYYLNNNYYVPTLYLVDYPIVIKRSERKLSGIKLTSTFNSISIQPKDGLITFAGTNIVLNPFLDLFVYYDQDQETQKLYSEFLIASQTNSKTMPFEDALNLVSRQFRCNKDKDEILKFCNQLFFDDYTKLLYEKCYNIPADLTQVFKHLFNLFLNTDTISFVDLNYKRLIFIEPLLTPYLKRVAIAALQAHNEIQINELQMNQFDIIKHFVAGKTTDNKTSNSKPAGLQSRYLYDNYNLLSAIPKYKIRMIAPGSDKGPAEIATIHPTHFRRICPISISDKDPGETLYLTPLVKVDEIGRIVYPSLSTGEEYA